MIGERGGTPGLFASAAESPQSSQDILGLVVHGRLRSGRRLESRVSSTAHLRGSSLSGHETRPEDPLRLVLIVRAAA